MLSDNPEAMRRTYVDTSADVLPTQDMMQAFANEQYVAYNRQA